MMKIVITIFISILASTSFAQEVEINDGKISIDGKEILKYEKIKIGEFSIFTLGDDEIIHLNMFDNETPKYNDDDYYVINFLQEKIKVESQDFTKISSFFNTQKTAQKLVKWLVKDKVLTTEGAIDLKKLEVFFQKYDENIVNRTIR